MRNIDAMVAERVMGWRPCPGDGSCSDADACFWLDSDGSVWHHGGIVSFSPSTDIAAAWEVVEKMNSDRWSVQVYNDPSGDWHCDIGLSVEVDNKSVAVAICHAALLALGVPEAEIQAAMEAKPCGD